MAFSQDGDFWSRFPVHDDGSGIMPEGGGYTGMGNGGWIHPDFDFERGKDSTGMPLIQPSPQPGGGDVSAQVKALIGNDYSPAHLKAVLPQLTALGVRVQNQDRGDLRPRFLMPSGNTLDFGPGGWIDRGNIGNWDAAYGGGPTPGGNGGVTGANGQYGGGILQSLRDTPGYQFTLGEGLKGIERSAFAKGGGLTGGVLKALMQYGSGLADTTYGNQLDRYYRGAQLGQSSIAGQSS